MLRQFGEALDQHWIGILPGEAKRLFCFVSVVGRVCHGTHRSDQAGANAPSVIDNGRGQVDDNDDDKGYVRFRTEAIEIALLWPGIPKRPQENDPSEGTPRPFGFSWGLEYVPWRHGTAG
jgi:hypothetical protein